MSAPTPVACPRCGKVETVKTWPAEVFGGFVAGCEPCYQDDVEQWRVGGAVPIVFAPTQRLAIEEWNKRWGNQRSDHG